MKKVLLVLLAVLLSACGGSDFVAGVADPPGDAATDATDAGQTDALQEGQQEATVDGEAGVDADAAVPESGPEADAAEPDADASVPEAAPDAQDEPEAAIEAAAEVGPDVCVPGTCQSMGKNCGAAPDGCGGTTSSCGSCPANQSCGGGGVSNVCGGCVPDTCAAHGYNRGSIPDGCGNTLMCGPACYNPGSASGTQCGYNGKPPNFWKCGEYGVDSGPPPFTDCVPHNTGMGWAYCCPEA